MVEGSGPRHARCARGATTTGFAGGPLPVPGRIYQPSKFSARAAAGSASPMPIVARGASASELVTG
jgi:hypothetical protein